MKQSLVEYYHKELDYLRRRGDSFASSYPKVAARLQLDDSGSRDPHVERLIQGVAFLNANIRKKIDSDFPQLCQSLLDVLYPHYLRPLPSYSMVSFEPDTDLTSTTIIGSGTELEAATHDEYVCRFKTVYPVEVMPVKLTSTALNTYPVIAPKAPNLGQVTSVLKMVLETTNTDVGFHEIELNKLRFFIKGNKHYNSALYELIHNHVTGMAIAERYDDPNVRFINNSRIITPVGFEYEDGLLPYPKQSFIGYRLLSEYFAFPEKFMFFDVNVNFKHLADDCHRVELYLYLNKDLPDIESTVSADNFLLGATPIINIFDQIAEPTKIDDLQYEYPVVPDARNPQSVEVYTVDEVLLSDANENSVEAKPFFGIDHLNLSATNSTLPVYWHARREEQDIGECRTETHLSLVSQDMSQRAQRDWVMIVQATCFNGNMPKQLSKFSAKPNLRFSDGASGVSDIELHMPFSEVSRSRLDDDLYWRLLSHLNLNYLSLEKEGGTLALREILNLYNLKNTTESVDMIEAISIVSVTPSTSRLHGEDGLSYFCRGQKVVLQFDMNKFVGSNPYLLASILERFLALYTNINSFVQLEVIDENGNHFKKWAPRIGEQCMI